MSSSCCPTMADMLRLGCQEHGWDCPDVIVRRLNDGSFIIPIHDGGASGIEIKYCPWCGTEATPDAWAAKSQVVARMLTHEAGGEG